MSFQLIISRLVVLPFLLAFSACFGSKPNFLVIVVDDMGYADVSAYGHRAEDAHTPNIDKLASRGILFTNAYVSAPVCSPSRAGWVTGNTKSVGIRKAVSIAACPRVHPQLPAS